MSSPGAQHSTDTHPEAVPQAIGAGLSAIDREIELLIEAEFPFLSIASHEEWRVLEQLEKIAARIRDRRCAQLSPEERNRKYQVVRWTVTDGLEHWSHHDSAGKRRPRRLKTDWMERQRENDILDPGNPVDVMVNLRFPPKGPVEHVAPAGPSPGVDLNTAIFVFCDLHHWLDREDRASRFNHVLVRALRDAAGLSKHPAAKYVMVFLSPRSVVPMELEKEIQVVDYPLPTLELLTSWFIALEPELRKKYNLDEGRFPEAERQRLIHALSGLTFDEALHVLQKAFASGDRSQPSYIEAALREKQQIIKKDGMLEYFESDKSMADVGGLERLRQWLDRRSIAFRGETVVLQGREITLPVPKGLLMIGVPGGGKSLVAKAVAKTWGLPLLRLDIGRIFGGVVGQSEENMRRAIRIARSVAPAVLWLDEVEKAFPSTSGGGDSGTSLRVMNTFLTWLQEKTEPVFVVATGNNLKQVPPELTRKGRFDEIFYVGLPNEETRKKILEIHCRDLPIPETDYKILAKQSQYFTGAEIEQCVKDSYFLLRLFLSQDPLGPAPLRTPDEPETEVARCIFAVMKDIVPLARRQHDGKQVLRETLDEAISIAMPASASFEDLPPATPPAGAAAPQRGGWSRRDQVEEGGN
jgi:hypothetical protein